jgi:hypothetical protein
MMMDRTPLLLLRTGLAKPVNIPKITILLDNGYHPAKLTIAMQVVYPQIVSKIRLSVAFHDVGKILHPSELVEKGN